MILSKGYLGRLDIHWGHGCQTGITRSGGGGSNGIPVVQAAQTVLRSASGKGKEARFLAGLIEGSNGGGLELAESHVYSLRTESRFCIWVPALLNDVNNVI